MSVQKRDLQSQDLDSSINKAGCAEVLKIKLSEIEVVEKEFKEKVFLEIDRF